MAINPLQYTSRTFSTVLADINDDSELVDKPEWFKRLIAGLMDVLSMYINASVNQSFLRTAFTRQSVADLLALIDYYMNPKQTSSGTLLFYLNPDTIIFPKTIALEDLAARSEGTVAVSSKKFEARAAVTITALTTEGFTTDFSTDSRLDVARVYTTGEKVRVSTDTTLPAPLQAATDYYAIYVSDTEILLAETLTEAYLGTSVTLTSDGAGNHTISLYTEQVDCYQQQSVDSQSIGVSDGITEFQTFDLPDVDVLSETLSIVINGDTWTLQDTLVDSVLTDKHFLLKYNTDNSSFIMFGNGTLGAIPAAFDIYAAYATGGGATSNISTNNKIKSYAGSDADITGVSNASAFTGGADEENIEIAKILAPILLKARDRFVTVEDGEALALAYGGIIRAKVNKNVYGLLSCQVPIVPAGGGNPSGALKTALQTYLIEKTILSSIDVRVVDPSYITVTPIATVKILSGYVWANVQPYLLLALRLLFSEITYEIYLDFVQSGIASAIEIINTKWSTSFSEADYAQIQTLVENVTAVNFGAAIQESSVLGFIDTYVDGVDYILMTAPTFPVSLDDDEITTDDVLTGNITEIP